MKAILKSYSSIITRNLSLFLAVGVLNIFFSERGWFPNETMNQVNDVLYGMVIPLLMAYEAGGKGGERAARKNAGMVGSRNMGNVAGALASVGLISVHSGANMIGAVILGAAAGYLAVRCSLWLENRVTCGLEMIVRNCVTAACGLAFAGVSLVVLEPFIRSFSFEAAGKVKMVLASPCLFLLNLLIEPMKVFFLNNSINHGILIPLGMEQMKEAGSSVLFLLESNPGPGLGVLAAFWMMGQWSEGQEKEQRKEKRRQDIGVQMAIECLGGIHEVYFPYVLYDLRLLVAVMAGGTCGSLWFFLTDTGIVGPAVPGSILTILLLCPMSGWLKVLTGIAVSFAVSFIVSCGMLKVMKEDTDTIQKGKIQDIREEQKIQEIQDSQEVQNTQTEKEEDMAKISKIYVVCDAGLGSSAMGAALFRRKIKEAGYVGVSVRQAAADEIPDDGDLIVCQKDFYIQRLKEREAQLPEIRLVETLTNGAEYAMLLEEIKGRL